MSESTRMICSCFLFFYLFSFLIFFIFYMGGLFLALFDWTNKCRTEKGRFVKSINQNYRKGEPKRNIIIIKIIQNNSIISFFFARP